ncbi:MAG: cyclase family protein, partial [Chloroflexi bacterium]|nr:cyclase family protein [Chloroflexota bacterium]
MTTKTRSQLTNWGRWGPDDERGTLNLITPAMVAAATRLVKTGRIYSLGVSVGPDTPRPAIRNQIWHLCMVRKDPTISQRRVADDTIMMHVHSSTHIDALSHLWYEGKLYNGYPEDSVNQLGATKNSITNVKGLIGRGVLLDVARYKGMERLDNNYVVTPEDLDACARAEKVEVKPGDIVLVRTGFITEFKKDTRLFESGEPGPGKACIEWFHTHQLCAIGADNVGVERLPAEDPDRPMVFHECIIRDLGGYLIELVDLEELARDRVYEFLFVAAPLMITKG